jgi:endonuclease/exonuclease/phosphatase (EEP) superfamily protein YafD
MLVGHDLVLHPDSAGGTDPVAARMNLRMNWHLNWHRDRSPQQDQTWWQRGLSLGAAFWDVATWGYLAMVAVVAVSRLADGSVPVVLQPLQAGLPILFAPVWLVLFVAAVTRRWFQVPVAMVLAVTFIASVAPARQTVAAPYWVTGAPTLRVLSANSYIDNKSPDEAARTLVDRDADVMVILEFSAVLETALDAAGAARTYPYQSLKPRLDPAGIAIYSKLPFNNTTELTELKSPAVRLALPSGQFLWIAAVHPYPPNSVRESSRWVRSLRDLQRFASGTAGDDSLALIGDFNASRWQPSFGKLLAGPMIDAHEALGKGLSRSWPVKAGLPRLVRLDHALINERAFPTAVQDFRVPGSDHVAFEVTIAAKAIRSPGVAPGEDSIVTTTSRRPKKSKKRR